MISDLIYLRTKGRPHMRQKLTSALGRSYEEALELGKALTDAERERAAKDPIIPGVAHLKAADVPELITLLSENRKLRILLDEKDKLINELLLKSGRIPQGPGSESAADAIIPDSPKGREGPEGAPEDGSPAKP